MRGRAQSGQRTFPRWLSRLTLAFIDLIFSASLAHAQSVPLPAPTMLTMSPTGVDLNTGGLVWQQAGISIGGADAVSMNGGSAIAPVKRYGYVQRDAWIANGSGGFVHGSSQIWLRSTEKTCRTTATNVATDSCAGGSLDEVMTAYDYGPDTGLVGNTLWLRGMAMTADGVTLRTCYGYGTLGNKISETSPRAGLSTCS